MKKIMFIPMRSGSITIPNKNVKEIGGKPLYEWYLQEAINSDIDEIYLAIDTVIYENMIREKFTGQLDKLYFYYRDPENAQDNSTTESVMLEFIATKRHLFKTNDMFILGQITNPFIKATDINTMINIFIESDVYESMLTVSEIPGRFIWKTVRENVFVEPVNYNYIKRPLRQNDVGNTYYMENGAMYISYIQNIEVTKNRLCHPVGAYIMDYHTHYELDDEKDFIIIEALLKNG